MGGFGQPAENSLVSFCLKDRFGNRNCTKSDLVYRQLDFNTDPGVPKTEPQAGGAYLSEWIMVEYPEESKYTTDLSLFYSDFTKFPDDYVFVPALRRTLRVATSARCAPLFGSDMTHDDQKTGFNSGLTNFQAKWLGDRKILGQMELTNAEGNFPDNYSMPLGWAKPSWGPWSLRDSYVLDVRRIPAMAPGYCYGSRTMFIDKEQVAPLWIDLYDGNMKLWKVVHLGKGPSPRDPATGQVYEWGGPYIEQYWDVQNDHASHVFGANEQGKLFAINGFAPKQYDNVTRYSTPGGLMQVMR